MKRISLILIFSLLTLSLWAQNYTIKGKVMVKGSKDPIDLASVVIPEKGIWSVTNEKGEFIIVNIPKGKYQIEISCLTYVTTSFDLEVKGDVSGLEYIIAGDNLTLESAVITASEKSNSSTTSRTIDRVALEHMQLTNVANIGTLLPGGSTSNPNLTGGNQSFVIRGNSSTSEIGNAAFGTALEIDGVRLSNNASYDQQYSLKGVDTKSISTTNIESVEVISGVPSVEYGDMNNGVVKIKTKDGATPFQVSLMTNANTKQASLSKGIKFGKKGGILNASAEYTNSISDLASPYTSYDRGGVTLNYSNTFIQKNGQPVNFKLGVTGNLGGYDSKTDPDNAKNEYSKRSDNTLRANIGINYLLNKSWITNIDFKASVAYSDNLFEQKSQKSSPSYTDAIHGMETGYFVSTLYKDDPNAAVTSRPSGFWEEYYFDDNKTLDYNIHLQANWITNWGDVKNKIKLGVNFTGNGNYGKGAYYDDPSTAPSWRPYEYSSVPFMNNLAAYLEENITVPIGSTSLNVIAGVRSEWTMIEGSAYGTVNSVSPRFNGRYSILPYNRDRKVKEFSIRGSWGVAVKLPSFSTLYPRPVYEDVRTFVSTSSSTSGAAFSAYYIDPVNFIANPNLKWQRNQQSEIGIELDLGWVDISLAGYYNKTMDAYYTDANYVTYTYKWTDQKSLNACPIPVDNRDFSIDQKTGVVTVTDKSGVFSPMQLSYTEKNDFKREIVNGNEELPVVRKGVEWVFKFAQIKPIMTSIQLDGNYYNYVGHSEHLVADIPALTMPDGVTPFQYVGHYVGADKSSNGYNIKSVNTNLTFTTHIPQIRMIISLRIESSLYRSSQNLSESSQGQVTYPVDLESNSFIPTGEDFYNENTYTATYPLYYSTWDDPTTKIPFMERFLWAKDNDPELFNSLAKLVNYSPTSYYFDENVTSPYVSANISITKEIGDIASLSFYANNFLHNLGRVKTSWNDKFISLYDSAYIPKFYYGLTLRIKF